jgi:hypothetical protein
LCDQHLCSNLRSFRLFRSFRFFRSFRSFRSYFTHSAIQPVATVYKVRYQVVGLRVFDLKAASIFRRIQPFIALSITISYRFCARAFPLVPVCMIETLSRPYHANRAEAEKEICVTLPAESELNGSDVYRSSKMAFAF